MSGNMALLVGCRLIAIWFGANAIHQGTAWVGVILQTSQGGGRNPYSMENLLLVGIAISFVLAVGLWFSAPVLSRAGGSGTVSMSGDTTRSLLKVLGVYFVIRSLSDIARYIALTVDEDTNNVFLAIGGGQPLVQTILFLAAGILLIAGVGWIKAAVMKVSRYGLDEPPKSNDD